MDELLTDIAFDGADFKETQTGDLGTISGAPNVAQAALRCVMRSPGELVWAPGYGAGVLQWLEAPNTPGVRLLAGQLGQRALRQDPRLGSVTLTVTASPSNPERVTLELSGVTSTAETLTGVTTFGG